MTRPAPRHAPRVPFALLVTALVVGGMALLLALNTASAANELRRHDLAVQDGAIAAQVEQLHNDVAASSAPANLAAAAAALGMVPDGNPAFIVVDAAGHIHLRGVAAQATEPPVAVPHPAVHRHPKPKPKPTKSAATTASKAAKASKTATSKAPTTSASRSASASRHAPAPSPTPTPTPVVTLPGGTR